MTFYLLALHGQGLRRVPGSTRLGLAWLGLAWLNRSLFTAATLAISGALRTTLKWPFWEFQPLLAPIFSRPVDEFVD